MTIRSLVLTYLLLVALALVSWAIAATGAGGGIALAIASAKALAIALVFMELWHAPRLERAIAGVAVAFIVLLTLGAITDVALR